MRLSARIAVLFLSPISLISESLYFYNKRSNTHTELSDMVTAYGRKRFAPEFTQTELYLWAVAIALLLIDIGTTWYVIGEVGLIAESNPIMAHAMEKMGRLSLIPAKIFVFAVGMALRPVTDAGKEWMLPLGIIIPMAPLMLLNIAAVITLAL